MTRLTADAVICGAGIAGVATAYHLSHKHGIKDLILVDERPPLSLTSDKSTECYRNWWPGPGSAMVELMNHSIDLLEEWANETGNLFHLNRRGYLFATADADRARSFEANGREISELGAGPFRVHRPGSAAVGYVPAAPEGYHGSPAGADLLLDQDSIRRFFPYLSHDVIAVLHTRRCGWFSAQQLGNYLLEQSRQAGAQLIEGTVTEVITSPSGTVEVRMEANGEDIRVSTPHCVIAAGPKAKEMAAGVGVELPVFCELHSKISFNDRLGAMPRTAPLLIWSDPQAVHWRPEEVQQLESDPELKWLLGEFPEGVHARPDGPESSPVVLLLWTYHMEPVEPVFPPPFDDDLYPELALRGFSRMVPRMLEYLDRLPRPFIDGGYYVKTEENRPLIGPLPAEGIFLIGALSGFGLMASAAAGELASDHVAGASLPSYAKWFSLDRYQDPSYGELLSNWGSSGQL